MKRVANLVDDGLINHFFKRYIDILFSGIGLLLLSPVILLIALCIKLDSPGPVFYLQGRLGKGGKPFRMVKFRTMIQGAEKMPLGLFNYANDPRVTRVGRFLRNTSLDEIPQLINVLMGEMSIVGPRPPVIYELGDFETLNPRYKKRFNVLPGITGLAQVMGRNSLGWERKVVFDNEYIDRFQRDGIAIDLQIILRTFVNVFRKEDIYEEKENPSMSDEEAALESAEDVVIKAHAIEGEPEPFISFNNCKKVSS